MKRTLLGTPTLVGRLPIPRAIMRIRFKVKVQMVKVTRPTDACTVNARNIFRMGIPMKFKLGTRTEQEDPHQQQAPWPPRSRSRDASERWPISWERNVLETPKVVGRLSTPRAIMRTSFKVKVTRPTKLRPDVRHIFRTERPTNFKLGVQMEDEDPYSRDGHHQQGQRLRSRLKGR